MEAVSSVSGIVATNRRLTSMPGLPAMDVIDIQSWPPSWNTERIVPAIAGTGFERRTAPWNLRDHVPVGGSEAPEAGFA